MTAQSDPGLTFSRSSSTREGGQKPPQKKGVKSRDTKDVQLLGCVDQVVG